jgi:hypothetical protein
MTAARVPQTSDDQPTSTDVVLPVGLPVYTSDGHQLGRVKEADERCFLVDVRFAFDYWLSMRAVAAVHRGRVLLGIDKRHVEEYLVDVDCLDDFEHLQPVTPDGTVAGLLPAAS